MWEASVASIDVDTVVSYRGPVISLREEASHQGPHTSKYILKCPESTTKLKDFPTLPGKIRYHAPLEEIA